MTIFHLIVRRPYEDLSGIMMYFREKAVRFLVGEHNVDRRDKKVHCHLAIDYPHGRGSIEKQVLKYKLNGQGQFAIMTKTQKTRQPYDFNKLNEYILKGDKKHLRDTNQSEEYIEQCVNGWVSQEILTPVSSEKPGGPEILTPVSSESGRKKKADAHMTQYKIIQEVIEYGREQGWIVTSDYNTTDGCNSIASWHRKNIFKHMCTLLNKYQIRTSRNELERIYVTILRLCPETQSEIYESIYKNIFR